MLQPGETFGEYQIVDLIGSGGQGDVFRVRDRLGLEWALKVSHEFTFDNAGSEARFHQEAQWVSQALRGLPRDCGVFVGEHYGIEARRFYAKMRLLTGENLGARLKRVGRFSLQETLEFGEQVARAMGAAHRAGALHRDLKPENVFIEADGKVQVLDWGCLQVIEAGRAGSSGSGPICTPGYAGLEQYQGARAQLTASTDVYSLGVMLYEVIAGCHPFLAWSRGPREGEEQGPEPEALSLLQARVHAPRTHAESPEARRDVPTGAASLPHRGAEPVQPPRQWGVGDECVTMPAGVGLELGHFDQRQMLGLLKQKRTLRGILGWGRVWRAEDLQTKAPDVDPQPIRWPAQAEQGIREPSAAQLAQEVVVPQRGPGGKPRRPSVFGVTQAVAAPSIEVTSFEVNSAELRDAGLNAGSAFMQANAEECTQSLAALHRAGRVVPEAWLKKNVELSTFEQAQHVAAAWNVPSTHTASQPISKNVADSSSQRSMAPAAEPSMPKGRPRKISTPDVIRLQLRVKPRPIDGIPQGLWSLLERMLAKHPEQRPQTMDAVAEALSALLLQLQSTGDEELRSVTVDQSQATWQHLHASLRRMDRDEAWAERRQSLGRAAMLVCGGAAAFGVLVWVQGHPNQSQASAVPVAAAVLAPPNAEPSPAIVVLPPAINAGASAATSSLSEKRSESPAEVKPVTASNAAAVPKTQPARQATAVTRTAQATPIKPEARRTPRSALLVAPPLEEAPAIHRNVELAVASRPSAIPKGFKRLTPEQERVQVQYLTNAPPLSGTPVLPGKQGKP